MSFGHPEAIYEDRERLKKIPPGLTLDDIVYITISRLCDRRGRYTNPSIEEVRAEIRNRYGVEYSRRSIEEAVSRLEARGHVYRLRGLLKDGRITLFTTREPERVAFVLLPLGRGEALVHDDVWEGKVYDPLPLTPLSTKDSSPHALSPWWALSLAGAIAPLLLVGAIITMNELKNGGDLKGRLECELRDRS
jgi:hypothetical protein